MAIKINNKDLARRIINWNDVQRVILNWSQIRPTSQPHVDYHVISNWGTGWWGWWGTWIPWGWSTWGSATVWESWVSNWWVSGSSTHQYATLQYDWLPSLLNAYKVEIVYSFYWNQSYPHIPFYPFESYLNYSNIGRGYEARIGIENPDDWQLRLKSTDHLSYDSIDGGDLSIWNYVMTATLDLENETANLILEWPNGFSKEIQFVNNLTSTEIFNIRHSTDFWVYLNDWINLSRVDFYVYNSQQSQSVWAWIYHNATLWLISYSLNGENWITIADKDLWASAVYGQWNLYQWGNNHWFPTSWFTTSSTKVADVSNYWPWNYYESSTFITWGAWYDNWFNTMNSNLRWWVTDTDEAKRWPCSEWYHVPTATEFSALTNIITTLVGSNEAEDCHQYFLINSFNTLDYDWDVDTPLYWYTNRCWFSTVDVSRNMPCYAHVYTTPTWVWWEGACHWLPIRPFKNTYVVPDSTRTVLYQPQ